MSQYRERFFSRYERFWHWSQAFLIIALIVTGFHVTGLLDWLEYEHAAQWHRTLAFSLIWLWIFTIFWHLITGEWRQYIPTTEKMFEVIHYYSSGIFDPLLRHPFKKTRRLKHNPLQRVAYLVLSVIISPILWLSGLLFVYYNDWPKIGIPSELLSIVAGIHLSMAYAMICFFVLHFYMAFVSKPPTAMIKAMITGYLEVDDMEFDFDREYRLLVIEDDPIFALLIKEWFEAYEGEPLAPLLPDRITIIHVESLKKAVEILKQQSFDWILLDISLPDSQGIETFRTVKSKAVNTPVLMMSDMENEALQSRGIHEGAQDFLIKHNLSRRALARAFRFALERHGFIA
ncbi:MAG: cytochrome b/b6 domain-containing protein [Magnetococcales bacterium]|nr:cytochrome b/b6 domain-containing protein [Magnetococcales bacterium]MBF0149005.1 cytochrome b/b6 domain-containing protein [Magnetococcales bacterium]MBF0172054.1 cytochrome b/b6 domain-containing protein [Magnetococcales bacterium]MBF0346167.1 cytochrome b/b6 domain-containing protein [Magnetococcales bacterium]MBF0630341.1 cytochrome b/b6 domain-containing protein [Magnetococcales bacterium]